MRLRHKEDGCSNRFHQIAQLTGTPTEILQRWHGHLLHAALRVVRLVPP